VKSKVKSQKLKVKTQKALSILNVALTACFFFYFGGSVARATTLEGTVFDPSGRVIPGAQVSLLVRLAPLDERQTDARGRYRFTGVRGGTYSLVANASGFSTAATEVELRQEETRTLDLHLQLSALEQHVVVSA
jgi:hypothetical protein